jgi:thiamine-phosphate pyrophosphorylase
VSNFPNPPVRMLITPGTATQSNFSTLKSSLLETVGLAVTAGIEIVQLREKQLTGRQLFELAVDSVALTANSATKLLINERFDIAIAANADGVHLTSASIPIEQVRPNVPEKFVIGVSAHSADEVRTAKETGADYAMFGPVFSTPGKGEPCGLENLREACRSVSPFPVVAVGGIDDANFQSVLEAGASGYAAIRYLNDFVKIAQ